MKYIYKIMPVLMGVFLMASCTNDALDDLEKKADEQAKQIAQFWKEDAKKIENDIKLIQSLFDLVKDRETLMISDIKSINENGQTGYSIEFTDGRDPIEINDGVTPTITIDDVTKNWVINGENTGILATGRDVEKTDLSIYKVQKSTDGFWEISSDDGITWTKTSVRANGETGDDADPAPVVTVENNVWVINGVPTTWKVKGDDARAPKVEAREVTGVTTWHFSNDNGVTWTNTGVPVKGNKGEQGDKGEAGTDAAIIKNIIFDGENVKFTFGNGLKIDGTNNASQEYVIKREAPFAFKLKNGTNVASDFADIFDIYMSKNTILEYQLNVEFGTPRIAFAPKGMIVTIAPNTTGLGKISIIRQADAVEGTILLEVSDLKNNTIVRRIKVKPATEVIRNIGDLYEGGIIFYLNPNGSPKIKTVALTETELEWTNRTAGSAMVGTNDVANGIVNMTLLKSYLASTIIDVTIANYPAFQYCNDLNGGWYFPAKEEIGQLFDPAVLTKVNDALNIPANNGAALDLTATYWSSTQINAFSVWGYEQGTVTPLAMGTDVKYKVRAIKAFN